MLIAVPIFAQGEDPTLKIIIGLVFAGIWVLAQVAGAWNERQKKKQRRQQTGQVELPGDVIVPMPAPGRQRTRSENTREGISRGDMTGHETSRPSANRTSPPPRSQPPRSQAPRVPPTAKRPPRRPPPPPVQRRPDIPTHKSLPGSLSGSLQNPLSAMSQQDNFADEAAAASAISKVPIATSNSGIPQSSLRIRSLLRPRNLRKEFILTEILQPPVAMRPSNVLHNSSTMNHRGE
jgi:hypothetical protein